MPKFDTLRFGSEAIAEERARAAAVPAYRAGVVGPRQMEKILSAPGPNARMIQEKMADEILVELRVKPEAIDVARRYFGAHGYASTLSANVALANEPTQKLRPKLLAADADSRRSNYVPLVLLGQKVRGRILAHVNQLARGRPEANVELSVHALRAGRQAGADVIGYRAYVETEWMGRLEHHAFFVATDGRIIP